MSDDIAIRTENLSKPFGRGAKADEAVKILDSHPMNIRRFLAGFGLSVLEPMSLLILVVAGRLLNRMEIVNLYRFAATYHLDNARSWLENGQPLAPPLAGFTAEPTLLISLTALALWIIVLVGLSILFFSRQDLTS